MGRYGVGLGLGKRRRIGAPPPPPAPPVNVTPAAISGTAQQNAVLTAAPGAWSGATDGVTGQWRRAAVAIAGETGLTYLQTIDDVGTMIDYFETATNAGGVSTQASNALGPVAAAGGLSSTAATRTTADGVAPEVDLTFGADINPGFYLRIQRTDTSSGGTGDYTAPDMNIRHMLTPDEIPQDASNGTIASLSLQADGYTDPTGAYWQRYRWENEDASLTGPWSEIHDTVVVSVAKLSETTGTEKHTSLTVDPGGLGFSGTSSSTALAKATVAAVNAKFHMEITVTAAPASTHVNMGVGQTGLVVGPGPTGMPSGGIPGNSGSTNNGFTLRFEVGATPTFFRNNGLTTLAGFGNVQAGDIYAIEYDTATSQATFHRSRAGVVTSLAAVTLTALIPTSYVAFAGTSGAGAGTRSGTVNFGGSAFAITPTAGYDIYG